MKEFKLIDKFFKPLAEGFAGAQNLSDDVAKISLTKDETLIISKDMMVENVHFLVSDGGFKIASKLLLSNLSDLASAGAKPLYYLLGFSKNHLTNKEFVSEFSRGLKTVQDKFNLGLIGGDTVSAKELTFSITIFGSVKNNKNLSRPNAKAGDLIFVSGTIGDAYLGLQIATKSPKVKITKNQKYFLDRHFFPQPRIELGQTLLKNKLSSCAIDVSDGLLSDLNHICQASKVDAEIYQDKLPISAAAKKVLQSNPTITTLDLITAGDDYELIFTAAEKNHKKITALANNLGLDLTYVGKIKKSTDNKFQTTLYKNLQAKNNQIIKTKKYGYEH